MHLLDLNKKRNYKEIHIHFLEKHSSKLGNYTYFLQEMHSLYFKEL